MHGAHTDFLKAGADVIKTASYQMSLPLLSRNLPQLSQQDCLDLIKESVRVARNSCKEFWQSMTEEQSIVELLLFLTFILNYNKF